jgi:phospholipid/cholesterol/gamma-HCH transport system permease protein
MVGRLDVTSVAQVWREARERLATQSGQVIIDCSGVEYCDGAGVGLLVDLLGQPRPVDGAVQVQGLAEPFQRTLAQFDPVTLAKPLAGMRLRTSVPEEVGAAAAVLAKDLRELVTFTGDLAIGLVLAVRHWRKTRWADVWLVAEQAGANALPIVALISFLMGVILAFQSAVPMKQFGAEIFVADLVALSVLREIGPLMTAILMAGRTGSAFAAEIGTMKVNEEVNALVTMGLDPVRFLATPRVLGAVATIPLLTVFANCIGLAGGALVMLTFDIPLVTFVNEVRGAVGPHDLLGGLAKAFVFGLLVAALGCQRGLQTKAGPSAVGLSATRSVVSGIVAIVIADGVFSVLYYHLGI